MALPKNKRIADYIRTGLSFDVDETRECWMEYYNDKNNACAVGFAIIGKLGVWRGYQTFFTNLVENGGDEFKTISDILEVEPLLVEEINKLHMMGVPAEEIAECLEYEEGDD